MTLIGWALSVLALGVVLGVGSEIAAKGGRLDGNHGLAAGLAMLSIPFLLVGAVLLVVDVAVWLA